MNHKFQSSQMDASLCIQCKKDILTHTDMAVCECCPNIGPVEMFGDMAMCSTCIANEMKLANEYQSPELQSQRLSEYKLKVAEQIDSAIQFRNDIFNAETVSIAEIKQTIDNDDTVVNKHYVLAEFLSKRYNHLKQVIFDLDAQKVEESNKQRAIQTYLNDLASRLREDERNRLKLQDISYQPLTKVVKAKPISKAKDRKDSIIALLKRENRPELEVVLNVICVQKNCTAEEAWNSFNKVSKEVESELS